jgi:hypothetical protein
LSQSVLGCLFSSCRNTAVRSPIILCRSSSTRQPRSAIRRHQQQQTFRREPALRNAQPPSSVLVQWQQQQQQQQQLSSSPKRVRPSRSTWAVASRRLSRLLARSRFRRRSCPSPEQQPTVEMTNRSSSSNRRQPPSQKRYVRDDTVFAKHCDN